MSVAHYNLKIRIRRTDSAWEIASPCGNFKEKYVSWKQVLERLRSIT